MSDPTTTDPNELNADAPWVPPFLAQYTPGATPQSVAPTAAPPDPSLAQLQTPDANGATPAQQQQVPPLPAPVDPYAPPPETPQPALGGEAPQVPPWLAAAQQQQQAPAQPATPPVTATDAALANELGTPLAGGQDPHAVLKKIATDPNATDSDRATAWKELPPDERVNLVNSADPKQLAAIATASMSPDELATIGVRHAQAQLHEQSAAQLDLARRTDETARQNFQSYQSSVQWANAQTDQLQSDAQALSHEMVDTGEHGVGNFIGQVLLSGIGGFASQATGGRNLALEAFQKQREQRIQAQKDAIANKWQGLNFKRNLVAEQLQRSGDLYHAQETYRVASYDRAAAELQTKMQDYDPQGTTAIKIAGTLQQLGAQRAATLQAYNQQAFKNKLDATKAQIDVDKQKEESRHNKAQEGIEWSKFGLEKQKVAGENITYTPAQLKALYGNDAAVPPVPMNTKQYDAWLGGKQKNVEIAGKGVENQAANAKNSVALPVQTGTAPSGAPVIATNTLTNKNGQTWRPPEGFQKMAGASANVVRLADKLSREIKKNGGQSDLRKSPEWQQMKSDYQDLVFALHGAKGIEGFRPGTSELLHELTGGVDPTSFLRSAIPGIQNAKQNVVEDLNATATAGGYDGTPIQFLDTSAPPPPARTELGELAKTAAADPSDDSENAEYNIGIPSGAASSDETAHAIDTGIPPVQLGALHRLQEALINPATTQAARAELKGLIDKAADPAVSNWADAVLKLVPEKK
jgi:hypothetical protein